MASMTTPATTPRIPWARLGIRGMALSYLFIMLIIPISVIFWDGFSEGMVTLWQEVTKPIAWSALKLTLWTSAVMAIINGVMGLLTAFVLVRYTFPGKTTLNAIIDLPLAIPTLVTGLMLVALYGPQQVLGQWILEHFGQRIIFAPPGIVLALLFVTFPFVVRSVQPVLLDLDQAQEDAAATLAATSWMIFHRITFPAIRLPLLSGMLLSFARAIGEFGAIVIVAGNIPFRSQTAAVYVYGEVESENRLGASAMSVAMMLIAFSVVALVGYLERRGRRG
ncbi:MAG: sulfate ABC transporter permease subunit [Chloroflexi bacterium]|nr:sulfate ABC transporter permease subunit [Ardenticatenaceae bacterium]MBL1130986.1 sulfate ABC transporter permease subunit [Chloroflexota bacterium]NOG37084.1 sulfate ABC transporter permease subunit [Chloroflexota bacterium]GIK58917.1 MAG: sulfate ABC transporter permease [Chloroflexota bacterium]